MAAALQLQLVTSGGGTVTFDVEGEFTWEVRPEYHEGTEPPRLARHVERWGAPRCRLTGASPSALWDNLLAFVGDLEDGDIVAARIVRDPSGVAAVERTMGASGGYQRFVVEELRISKDPQAELEAASFRTVVAIDIAFSAEKVFADADGILKLRQTVKHSYPRALHGLQWVTDIETAEGVNAETKARTFGAIPIDEYGGTYVWDATNGPEGVDVEVLDADERSTSRGSLAQGAVRTPTRARATSRITQKGITIGSNEAGAGVENPVYEVEERTEDEVYERKYRISAEGPAAEAWVVSKVPVGPYHSEVFLKDDTRRIYSGTWIIRERPPTQPTKEISVTVSGGHRDTGWWRLTGALRPEPRVGSFAPYRIEVTIRRKIVGSLVTRADMLFPPELGAPMVLDRNASTQDLFPRVTEASQDPNSQKWERAARLIYTSSRPPALGDLERLLSDEGSVQGYYL